MSFCLKNLVWTPELRPGTPKIGFLVKNYPYGEILGTLGPDLGPYTSMLILIKEAMSKGGGTQVADCLLVVKNALICPNNLAVSSFLIVLVSNCPEIL